jgi:beta-glucosidase
MVNIQSKMCRLQWPESKLAKGFWLTKIAYGGVLAAILCSPSASAIDKSSDSADIRAERLLQTLTAEEKERLIVSALSLQSAGLIRGLPDRGFPSMRESDSTVGVFRWLTDIPYVSLPSAAGMAASWNPALIGDAYAMVAREARNSEISVLLAPAVNLVRELRNGRTYEYFGEDPLLAGVAAAAAVRGIQREKVVSTLKHYSLNDQETARHSGNVIIDEAAMRESDLLAFQLGVEADPGSVMCSYNKINGVYACQNKHLLTDILKTEWGFKGWVMTDWGAATDAVASANAGLDQISAGVTEQGTPNPFFNKVADFGEPLNRAISEGKVSAARRDDMVHRILRTGFAKGVVDTPAVARDLDVEADIAVARRMEEEAIVLLKNNGILPLSSKAGSVAVIGGHANKSVISKITAIPGDRKNPFGEPPRLDGKQPVEVPTERPTLWAHSSPFDSLRKAAPGLRFQYASGEDIAAAAQLAASSDIAVVFAIQDTNEGEDLRTLRLDEKQERLIDAVAKANRKVVVVLENGTAVTMPWQRNVAAIVAAWFPGSGGGEAIANVLTGRVNPSGKLPITFPISELQQPRPVIPGQTALASKDNQLATMKGGEEKEVDIDYRIEGSDVGYRWFRRQKQDVTYPFGHGLSYTTFSYSSPKVESKGDSVTVHFTVKNTGAVSGKEVAQVYLKAPFRLLGFSKVELKPREQRRLTVHIDPRLLSTWDVKEKNWKHWAGSLRIAIGSSSEDLPLQALVKVVPKSSVSR